MQLDDNFTSNELPISKTIIDTPNGYLAVGKQITLINKTTGTIETSIDNPLPYTTAIKTASNDIFLVGSCVDDIKPTIAKLSIDTQIKIQGEKFSTYVDHRKLRSKFIDIASHNNDLYVLGYTSLHTGLFLVKLSNNIPDINFGIHGKVIIDDLIPICVSYDTINHKIVVTCNNAIVRFNLNGTLDQTYGNNFDNLSNKLGVAMYDLNPAVTITSIKLRDNKILLIGMTASGISVTKYTSNGIIDNNFGTAGTSIISCGTASIPTAAIIDSHNNIYITGGVDYSNSFIFCLKPNGQINDSFFATGIKIFGFESKAIAIAISTDDSIAVLNKISLGTKVSKIKYTNVKNKSWFGYFTVRPH
jgi:hypothetical protein